MKKYLLALLLLLIVVPVVPSVNAKDWNFTQTSQFDDYFFLSVISGTVSDTTPTITFDTAKEYFEFTVTATTSGSNFTVEIPVPDCYMGADVYDGSTLKTGNSHYTLSVPYLYNSTSVPVKDWGSLTMAAPTGDQGIIKRVQLCLDANPAGSLKVRIYYATSPAVGFDGVNDYVNYGNFNCSNDALRIETFMRNTMRPTSLNMIIAHHFGGINGQFFAAVEQFTTINASNNRVDLNIGLILNLHMIYNMTYIYNGTYMMIVANGIQRGSAVAQTGNLKEYNIPTTMATFGDSIQTGWVFKGIIYNLTTIDDGTDVLVINASSFSGGASTTVDDFSASNNDGTAYGNVQYKVYTGTGFAFTTGASVYLTMVWGSHDYGAVTPDIGVSEYPWGNGTTLLCFPDGGFDLVNFTIGSTAYPNATSLTLYSNCTVTVYAESEDTVALGVFYTEILSFWLPFAVFALLSFWSIRMRGNYKYFGLVFPILGLTWAFAETSYPSALFYYVSATFFIFMLLFVGFKLAGLGGRNQRRWG